MVSKSATEERKNPFPGLRPFNRGESELFFGRDRESTEIADKLLRNRFVAITGVSGSGKTSLVNCGLIPAIEKLSSDKKERWTILTMKPGRDPYESLAFSLTGYFKPAAAGIFGKDEIKDILKEGTNGLELAIKKLSALNSGKALLFIDQFEEIFRSGLTGMLKPDAVEIRNFINLITHIVSSGNPDFFIIISLRSDVISLCEQFRGLTDLINNSSYLVSPIGREACREAITGPVRMAGAEIEDNLVEQLIYDLNESALQLPVLQYTLMRIWAHWRGSNEPDRPVDLNDYCSIGSIQDIISRQADEIYLSLDENARLICQKMFRILAGTGSGGRGIIYSSTIGELTGSISCSEESLIKVIDKFRHHDTQFIVPEIPVPLNSSTVIDISHESLIFSWGRLKKWVDEEAESVQQYLRLSEASALYQQGKAGLLKQPDLQVALSWNQINKPTVGWARKYDPAFERAIVYLRTSEKEYNELEERKVKHSSWILKKVKIINSVLGGLAVITVLLMTGAILSKISSDNRRRTVEQNRKDIVSLKEAAETYAAFALRKYLESDSSATISSRNEERERMLRMDAVNQAEIIRQTAGQLRNDLNYAKSNSLAAMMRADSATRAKSEIQRLRMITVAKSMSLRSQQPGQEKDLQPLLAYQAYLFNRRNNGSRNDADIYLGLYNVAKLNGSEKIRLVHNSTQPVKGIRVSPLKKKYFTSDSAGKILEWDLSGQGGEQKYKVLYSSTEIVEAMAVSPEEDWLACNGRDNSIKMISLDGNDSDNYDLNGHGGKVKSLVFSYDGNSLYSATIDGKVIKWDLATRTSVEMETGGLALGSLDLSYDEKYIAGISDQGNGIVLNPANPSGKYSFGAPGKKIKSIKFKPDEDRLAVGYDDGVVELWDVLSGKKITEFQAHYGDVNEIRFNPHNPQIATSGKDGSLKLWDSDDLISPPVCFSDNDGIVIGFEYSPEGDVLFAGSIGSGTSFIERPAYAEAFAADGCAYVTRNFTPNEWLAYVGSDIAYEKTCKDEDYSIKIKRVR